MKPLGNGAGAGGGYEASMNTVLLVALAIDPGAVTCTERVPLTAVVDQLGVAEGALVELDPDAFLATSDALVLSLPCVDEVIPPDAAARIHRLQGLRLYIARDESAAAAFAAARRADPDLTLVGLVPQGHVLHELFAVAPIDTPREPVPRPREGELLLDGEGVLERSDGRPVLFQRLGEGGEVLDTTWVPVDGLLPPYEAVPLPPGKGGPLLPRHKAGRAVLGVGVALTATAGALYGVAAASRASFFDDHPAWKGDDLQSAQARTNGLTTAASVLGGVGLGVGAVGVVFAW